MISLRQWLRTSLRRIFHKLPLSARRKSRLKAIYNNYFRPWVEQTSRPALSRNAYFPEIKANLQIFCQELYARSEQKSVLHADDKAISIERSPGDPKFIAFYLPQYHPIPENDAWWGKGFTEWTNVSKAVPQYCGHYQPHLPAELGFYDLRLIDVQKQQIELAKRYGVYGFCYYYYWFNGKSLLERPLRQLLENPQLDFPFCICWANENWSRRWDGMDHEILMEQHYSEQDDIAFIDSLIPLMRDSRYIRIEGRPVILLYRPGLLPDVKATTTRWRTYCQVQGIGELYLVVVKGLDWIPPEQCGFDAAVEFPPHTVVSPDVTSRIEPVNPEFSGTIYDFGTYVQSRSYLPFPVGKIFRGVMPSWDNTARKGPNGTIFSGASPLLYEQWLTDAARDTKSRFPAEERLVFINAWNEWAEGAHLEPDREYGHAWLEATAKALLAASTAPLNRKILLVGHDAHPHGAQILLLNIMKTLRTHFRYDVHLVLKAGGRMEEEYKNYGTVYNLEQDYCGLEQRRTLFQSIRSQGVEIAITNTVVTGDLVPELTSCGIRTISLVHELPELIRNYGIEPHAAAIANAAEKVVFPARFVAERYESIAALDVSRIVIHPQGLFDAGLTKVDKAEAKKKLRQRFKAPIDCKVVLAVAYGDYRKGIDLFLAVAADVLNHETNCRFLWVGDIAEEMRSAVETKLNNPVLRQNVIMIPFQCDLSDYYAGADIYLMTSREDPFPCVVMEAMAAGTPVIGFTGAGGFEELLIPGQTGITVPYQDIEAMSAAVIEWLNSVETLRSYGENSAELIRTQHRFLDYIYTLLDLLGHSYQKISVVLPNYNYARYLPERLENILQQTYPIYELILLDDASTDASRDILDEYELRRPDLIVKSYNEVNSGSVSLQWHRGIERSTGELVWIAEADDLAEHDFLETLIAAFADPSVVLAYCQSRQIDAEGVILAPDYLAYTQDIDDNKWLTDYVVSGIDEIKTALAVKNTIPNVSATLFRHRDITPILKEMAQYKIAGDWIFYIWLLQQGNLAYFSKVGNCHRRHGDSLLHSGKKELLFHEICQVQDKVAKDFAVSTAVLDKSSAFRRECESMLIATGR